MTSSTKIYVAWSLVSIMCVLNVKPAYTHDFLQAVATMWLGMLVSVSWTESWVKFTVPLLERHVAFDVGRHVFSALNTVGYGMPSSHTHARTHLHRAKNSWKWLPHKP
jgi:hypothetical protein